jgi:hypothetical protein
MAETVTVEAATVEQALAQVTAEHGPDARILRADRVRRGGIAGFFAREVVALEVQAPVARGVASAFDALLAAADDRIVPAPEPSGPEPEAPLPAFVPGLVTVDWDTTRMLELGLPPVIAQAVAALDPADDLGHLTAVAWVLAPVTGRLPSGPVRLVGHRAERLRGAVDFDESLDGHIHLVVGDELPDSLPGVPAVVSWVTDRGATRAISMALGSGARLGYGMSSGFGAPAFRVSALDAALAIRSLMERV